MRDCFPAGGRQPFLAHPLRAMTDRLECRPGANAGSTLLRLTFFVAGDVFWRHAMNSESFIPSGMTDEFAREICQRQPVFNHGGNGLMDERALGLLA